jgi:multidrug efflux pump subunit AcrA (membrane-fusion protein)
MLEASGLKLWQVGVLVAVLVLGIGGAYGGYRFAIRAEDDGLGEDQSLYTVTTQDLVNEVSVSGSLIFPNRETLSFGTQGTVGEVLVVEGESVIEGQPLAVLDTESLATLEKTVAQAKVSLRDAEEALDKARSPFTSLQIVQAEADVATAESAHNAALDALETLTEPSVQELAQADSKVASLKLSLEDARDSLDSILSPTAQELAQADSKVASLKLSLEDARDSLDSILSPTAQELVQAESRIIDARLSIDKASDSLEDLLNGPEEDLVTKAQSQIDSALTALTNAELDLELTTKEWDQKLEDAAASLEMATDRYSDVFTKWLGIELTEDERLTDADTLLQSWNTDLVALFGPRSRFTDLVHYIAIQGVPPDDPATRWNESTVYLWANFFPGAITVTCDDGVVPFQGECITQQMDDGWDRVWPVTDSLDTLETQAAKALSNAESEVSRNEDAVVDAQAKWAELFVESDPLEIESARISVELARISLQVAEEDLAELTSGPNVTEVEAKEKQVALALANLARGEEDLAELTSGPNVTEVEAKEKQVALALANLARGEEDLAELLAGPDPIEVAASRKQVDLAAARLDESGEALEEVRADADAIIVSLREADIVASSAALASALSRLDQATLTAPWDAVVSAIGVEVGQQVNANTLAIEILDQTVVEVNGVVDEIDVLFVREGASASVTMDALPGQVLDGVVSEIAAAANNQQGVVSYPISVRVEAPPGLALPEGLSAVASVVIREDRGVLLVPLDALYGSFEQPIIRIMNNGQVEERPVSLGNSDDFWVVVEDGIVEGNLVIMQSQEASSGGSGFAAIRGIPGQFGGFGGGFGGFGGGRGQTGVGR